MDELTLQTFAFKKGKEKIVLDKTWAEQKNHWNDP